MNDPLLFLFEMIDKSRLLKIVACNWNLFLKMDFSTKCYYCRLWDFKLVDVTLSYYVILPEFRIFYLEMRPIARILLK